MRMALPTSSAGGSVQRAQQALKDLQFTFAGTDFDPSHLLQVPSIWRTIEKDDPSILVEAIQTVADATSKAPEWRPLIGQATEFFSHLFNDLDPLNRPHDVCRQYLRIIANSVHEDCEVARCVLVEGPHSTEFLNALVACFSSSELVDFAMVGIMNLCVDNLDAQRKTVELGIDKEIARSIVNNSFEDEEGVGYSCAFNYFYLTTVDALLGYDPNQAPTKLPAATASLVDNIFKTYSILQIAARSHPSKIRSRDCLRVCLAYLQSHILQVEICKNHEILVQLMDVYYLFAETIAKTLEFQEPERTEMLEDFQELDESYFDDDEQKAAIRAKVIAELNRSGFPKDCRTEQLFVTDAIFERLVRISLTDEYVAEANAQMKSSPLLPRLKTFLTTTGQSWVHDALRVLACSLLANVAENVDSCKYLVKEFDIIDSLLSVMRSTSEPALMHVSAGLVRCLAKATENREILGKAGFIEQCVKYVQGSRETVRLQAAAALHLLMARCLTNIEIFLAASDYPIPIDSVTTTNPSSLFANVLDVMEDGKEITSKVILEIGKMIVAMFREIQTKLTDPTLMAASVARMLCHKGMMKAMFTLLRDEGENLRLEGLVGCLMVARTGAGAAYLAEAVNQDEEILGLLGKLGRSSDGDKAEKVNAEDIAAMTPESGNALGTLRRLLSDEAKTVLRPELYDRVVKEISSHSEASEL